jgi:putative acetyltransferase
MRIRVFEDTDLAQAVHCFTESVRVIAARHYDATQIEAWAPIEADLTSWRERLSRGTVCVAEAQGVVAGFVRVERSGLVDLLYVHPAHERQGIGGALLRTACSWAAENGATQLDANVSLTARSLFEAAGFCVQREQRVEYKGVAFPNLRMSREARVVPAASTSRCRQP